VLADGAKATARENYVIAVVHDPEFARGVTAFDFRPCWRPVLLVGFSGIREARMAGACVFRSRPEGAVAGDEHPNRQHRCRCHGAAVSLQPCVQCGQRHFGTLRSVHPYGDRYDDG